MGDFNLNMIGFVDLDDWNFNHFIEWRSKELFVHVYMDTHIFNHGSVDLIARSKADTKKIAELSNCAFECVFRKKFIFNRN